MVITREFDGKTVEIELTDMEMFNAYDEQQIDNYKEDMEDFIYMYDDDIPYFEKEFSVKFNKATAEESLLEMAHSMRHLIDYHEVSWDYARGEVLADWCRDNAELQEEVS